MRKYMYCLVEEDTTSPCKIGISNDPLKRRAEVNVGNHRNLQLAWCFLINEGSAYKVFERHMHRLFEDTRTTGVGGFEWFHVDARTALQKISSYVAEGLQ
jgi:hypothetical protein